MSPVAYGNSAINLSLAYIAIWHNKLERFAKAKKSNSRHFLE